MAVDININSALTTGLFRSSSGSVAGQRPFDLRVRAKGSRSLLQGDQSHQSTYRCKGDAPRGSEMWTLLGINP